VRRFRGFRLATAAIRLQTNLLPDSLEPWNPRCSPPWDSSC